VITMKHSVLLAGFILIMGSGILFTGCKRNCGVCQKTITRTTQAGTTVQTLPNIPACGKDYDQMNGNVDREEYGNGASLEVVITETRCGRR